MKREDLIKLGVAEDVVDKIMALHGQDITNHQTKLTTAQTELDGLKAQLTEANTTIEGFKKLDVDGIRKAADEWKNKAEQAQADASAQVAKLKFDHALDQALTGAKVKDVVSVRAHLKADALKLQDDGSILGLKEQLETIKTEKDFLFESDEKTPVIVKGGTSSTTSKTLTMDQIRGMKPTEINQNWDAVQETLKSQKAS
jgi:predicted  nucleic acid-binding Zn-ribbon protein